MSPSLSSALAAALAVILLANSAAAEPLHVRTPARLITDGGSDLRVPPGYYLPEPEWLQLDLKVKALQDDKVRLEAENKVFRDEPGPGWVCFGLVVGALAGGILIGTRF